MIKPELISVIIPSYNRAEFVRRAVQSVLDQTWKHIELIVIDDGSTDDTRMLLESFLVYDNFRYVYQDNKGRSDARNNGLALSSGTWIMYLDSDDWLVPTALDSLLELLAEAKESRIVYANFQFAENKSIQDHPYQFKEKQCDCLLLKELYNSTFWLTKTGSYLISRELAESVGGFETKYEPSEDLDYSTKVLINSKASYIPNSILFVERHQGNSDVIESQKALVNICRYYESEKKLWSSLLKSSDRTELLLSLRRRIANGSYETGRHGLAFRYYLKLLFSRPRIIFDKFIFKQFIASMLPPGIKKKWKGRKRAMSVSSPS